MAGGRYGDKSNDNTRVQGVDPDTGSPVEITYTTNGTRKRLDVDATAIIVNTFNQDVVDNNQVFSCAELINAATAGTDNPIILFKNPGANTLHIHFLVATGNATVSNERTLFKTFYNPTITTDGTAITTTNRNLGDSTTSSINVYSLPTISAPGTLLSAIQTGENTNSQEFVGKGLMALKPGENLLITADPKSNNRVQAVTFIWMEEA